MSKETLPISSVSFLVEGKDEEIVCTKILGKCRNIKIKFRNIEGNTKLISNLSGALKDPNIQKLAIIIDADNDINAKKDKLFSFLKKQGFTFDNSPVDLKGFISNQSTISSSFNKIVGIWIMPDNESSGMLEDFLINIIPQNDSQKNSVNEFLNKLEALELNLYNKDLHRSKAFINCWLSIQKEPGKPFGQAIDKNLFDLKSISETSYLYHFLNWYDAFEKLEIVEQ